MVWLSWEYPSKPHVLSLGFYGERITRTSPSSVDSPTKVSVFECPVRCILGGRDGVLQCAEEGVSPSPGYSFILCFLTTMPCLPQQAIPPRSSYTGTDGCGLKPLNPWSQNKTSEQECWALCLRDDKMSKRQ